MAVFCVPFPFYRFPGINCFFLIYHGNRNNSKNPQEILHFKPVCALYTKLSIAPQISTGKKIMLFMKKCINMPHKKAKAGMRVKKALFMRYMGLRRLNKIKAGSQPRLKRSV